MWRSGESCCGRRVENCGPNSAYNLTPDRGKLLTSMPRNVETSSVAEVVNGGVAKIRLDTLESRYEMYHVTVLLPQETKKKLNNYTC